MKLSNLGWTMLVFSSLLGLGACSQPSGAQTASEGSATTKPSASTTVPATATSNTTSQETASGATNSAPSEGSEQEENPYRQYQLKDLTKAKVKINGKTFNFWVMDTEGKRSEGMMFLQDREVKEEEGMIFVFSQPQELSFWMKNTYIPLDIAYVDAKGKIITIAQMNALDETGHPSKGKAKFAIEMKKGSFKKFGIKVGQIADIPLDVISIDNSQNG